MYKQPKDEARSKTASGILQVVVRGTALPMAEPSLTTLPYRSDPGDPRSRRTGPPRSTNLRHSIVEKVAWCSLDTPMPLASSPTVEATNVSMQRAAVGFDAVKTQPRARRRWRPDFPGIVVLAAALFVLISLGRCRSFSMFYGGLPAFREVRLCLRLPDPRGTRCRQDFGRPGADLRHAGDIGIIAMIIAVPRQLRHRRLPHPKFAPAGLRGPVAAAIELLAGHPQHHLRHVGPVRLRPLHVRLYRTLADRRCSAIFPLIGILFSGAPLGHRHVDGGHHPGRHGSSRSSPPSMRDVFSLVPTPLA